MSTAYLLPPFVVSAREGAMEVRMRFTEHEAARRAAIEALEDHATWGKDVLITITAREYVRPFRGPDEVRDVAPVAVYRR